MDLIEVSPDDLTDGLAFALLKHRKALQRWVSRRELDYDDSTDRQIIARALVEHIKLTGVEKVLRRVSRSATVPQPKHG